MSAPRRPEITDEAPARLADEGMDMGMDPAYGAHPLRRLVAVALAAAGLAAVGFAAVGFAAVGLAAQVVELLLRLADPVQPALSPPRRAPSTASS
ncbi:hypothetical protein [Streptomyces sp. NBC_01235]|uniref:hypothetical protein n=1 Tax=Streptomyces sp. NBC_01235 TaxID=2903788 RepID=UPI002E115224|nr:hypothetical protein OG289_16770 [Streptomyces sp. NBC_01235]